MGVHVYTYVSVCISVGLQCGGGGLGHSAYACVAVL